MPLWLRMITFLTIVSLVLLGMHWVIYRTLRFTLGVPPNTVWLRATVLTLTFWYIASTFIGRSFPNAVTEFFFTGASYWLGIAAYLFVFGAASELLASLAWLSKIEQWSGVSLQQFHRVASSLATALAIIFSIWAMIVAQGEFVVRKIEHTIPKLSPTLDGTRVVIISDLHIGAIHREKFVNRIVKAVNDLTPDLILIPGDLADGDRYQLAERLLPLRNLKAKYGVFWSTGNHEYYTGSGVVVKAMEAASIPVLRNQSRLIADGKIAVLGVSDPTDREFGGEGTRLDLAMQGVDPNLPILLMSHQPRKFREAFACGVDIMVSGHTHGGQTWPFNYIVDRVWEAPRGARREQSALLYTTVGIGTWGPPMRLSQPPEIVEITLRSSSQKQ